MSWYGMTAYATARTAIPPMQMQLSLDAGFPQVPAPQVLDDFLPEFVRWRAFADGAYYADVVSPVDGVAYPGIVDLSQAAPLFVGLLGRAMGRPVSINHLFMRLSLAGMHPPHWAHHDALMGDWSMMLYLCRPEHCEGGTALLEHVSGTDPDDATWTRDTNRPEQWRTLSVCPMATNRAFIFPARMWHAALPKGGFGTSAADGRLVLTAFFNTP